VRVVDGWVREEVGDRGGLAEAAPWWVVLCAFMVSSDPRVPPTGPRSCR